MKKLTQRIISLVLSIILLSSMAVVAVNASKKADEYEYTIDNNIVTITKYLGHDENIVVPSKIDGYDVKSISFDAFMNDNSKNIKSVVVSEGIETVGNWLFTQCTDIESITLPGTIKELATDWFFIGGNKLREFKFSKINSRYYVKDGVLYDSQDKSIMLCPAQNTFANGEYEIVKGTKTIRGWAFTNCINLKKVVMPDSITSIGDSAFSDCSNLKEIVLSENINAMSYNSFGNLINLKEITIPKNITGFYYEGQTVNTYLGYNRTEKIDNFTIKGYRNSEAEKYANDNGFKFIALDGQIDYSKYNPIEFIGMSFDEITNEFGNNYTKVEERESGLHKIICYPNTNNPFEFGFDNVSDKVIIVWIYDLADNKPIKLFDGITNESTLGDIEKSTTSFKYSKTIGANALDDNNIEQNISYRINNNIIINFLWTFNDFEKEPANRVLVMQGEVKETTSASTVAPTTGSNIKPTNPTKPTALTSTANSSKSDGVNNDNGIIKTGVISIAVIIFVILAPLVAGGFIWYRRRIK